MRRSLGLIILYLLPVILFTVMPTLLLAVRKLASRQNHGSTANEEKALNDSGAGNPINNLSKPSQTGTH